MYKCNVDAGWLAYFVNKLLRSLNQAARFPYNAVPPAGGLEGIVAPEISKPMTWWHGLLESTVRLWTVCMFSPSWPWAGSRDSFVEEDDLDRAELGLSIYCTNGFLQYQITLPLFTQISTGIPEQINDVKRWGLAKRLSLLEKRSLKPWQTIKTNRNGWVKQCLQCTTSFS